jgi:signal transduction histidine kinase/ActR/RegA family two-component response regulator
MALVAASALLPAILFAFAAWFSYREIMRESEARVERTVHLLEEHALKVFETQRLVIQQVDVQLRFMDWSRDKDRADLHALMEHLQADLEQVATITVTDAEGRMRASGRVYPADPSVSFVDRDWFQAVKAAPSVLPFVSRSYMGRQSGQVIFNLASRVPTGPDGAFAGAIALSADRAYFEQFYREIEPALNHSVILVRDDGYILASEPTIGRDRLPDDSALRGQIRSATEGAYTMRSQLDGVERIFAFRKIGPYPVYVRFGLSKHAALAPWRDTLINYGLVAGLASLALFGVSGLAVKQTGRERIARKRWEEAAAALQKEAGEREHVEQQLRQSQKMESVGRLTGGVAHDFNNLLTAVIGSLDLVLRRSVGIDDRSRQLINNAMDGANRAAALTSRLLAFSRQQPLQPVIIETNRLVAGMSDLLRRTLGETVAVETVLAGGLWPTLADPNQLESAILNLAVNARDAMPEGGRLTIETANAYLDEVYARANDDVTAGQYVLVAVSDTGTGMAPDVVLKVFEPFFTTKPVGKGTGLGLSQVYGFAKQSNGHVAVYSEVGHGSTFRIYLPRSRLSVPEPVSSSLPAAQPVLQRVVTDQTILVVEDEEMVRRLSVAVLEEAGYRVVQAIDGSGGLDQLRLYPEIALLFTDVVLGGSMNGRVLADAVLKEKPGLPVLFTTGYTRNAIIHHGRLDEGVNFIGKPFTGGALVDKVRQLLKPSVSHTADLAQDRIV